MKIANKTNKLARCHTISPAADGTCGPSAGGSVIFIAKRQKIANQSQQGVLALFK